MDYLLPRAYLFGLVVLLGAMSIVVARQILRIRRDELSLIRLESKGNKGIKDAAILYELASVQLRKRLYSQAAETLYQAANRMTMEPAEAKALIENALGFALAAQKEFDDAIKHYRLALSFKSDYPVALNNLAFALERQRKSDEAILTYKQVLSIDPANKTANKRLNRLKAL
uniref:TPR repeat protein n=1 Tax=Paulinella chromatophora TaxID=39717 RepID=B1X4K2_PAUCH|nr:TPR repeat protein [Paulinella chromatophora]ACB42871.1 TPR repeat protein [Paulinella chromatophora]|eukprot:gb/GEZN01010464.1/.p1 GENE.gb/GEZN01010464.1/~~gb/GEZN01010464.1/.p1  ORF type:complete len:172 (-),score=3.92 gb/GEZN01010464.1/:18-533(-)